MIKSLGLAVLLVPALVMSMSAQQKTVRQSAVEAQIRRLDLAAAKAILNKDEKLIVRFFTADSVINNPRNSLTLGVGITPAANGNRFGGSAFFDTGDTNPTTLAESVAGNDYFQLIVTPTAGSEG